MSGQKISIGKLAKGTSNVLREFKNNPQKVFFDTLNTTIDNYFIYRVGKTEVIEFLEKKLKELGG